MIGWFLGGLALGFLISYILTLYFDKPEMVINGKNKVRKGGNINFSPNITPEKKEKRKLFDKFKNRRNKK